MIGRRVTKGIPARLTFTLDEEERTQIQDICERFDRSLAWVVRTALREYLAKQSVNRVAGEE